MQTKKEKSERYGLLFLLVPFLFVPYIKLGGALIFIGTFTFLIPAAIIALTRPLIFAAWSRTMLALVSVLFLIVVSYALNMLVNNSIYRGIDLKGLKMGIANIFVFSSCLWFYYAKLRHWSTEKLVYVVYLAVLVNAFLSLAIFLSVDLESIFYAIFGVNELYFDYPFRRPPGLMYDGFSYLSSLLGLTFVIGVILFFESRQFRGFGGLLKFVVMQALLLVAIVINGRSGLVVCFTGIFIYFIVARTSDVRIRGASFMRLSLLLSVAGGIGAAAYFALINSDYGWYFDWAFGFLTDFLSGGEVKDSSVVEIGENHMFLPGPIFDVLFGRNDFNADPTINTYHSDLGYVQMIHGFGGITVGFLVMLCVLLMVACLRVYRRESILGSIVIIFIAEFLLLNFKDFYFVSPYPHFIAFYLFMIALFDRTKKEAAGEVAHHD